MLTRAYLEAKPNWRATYAITRRPGQHVCIMGTVQGGYYYHRPEYDGMFAWGATSAFLPSHHAHSVKTGLLRLVAGAAPGAKD